MFNEKIFKANFFSRGGRDYKGAIRWGIAPIFSWGPPGVGKTEKAAMLAKKLDCDFVHSLTLGNETPATIGGIPFPDKSGQFFRRLPPAWVHNANNAKRALIIIDEFGDAPALMQACAQKVINEHVVGDTPLAGHVRFACFGNPPDMSTNAYETGMATANRGGHESLVWGEQNVNEWMQWAIEDGGEVFEPERMDGDAEEARVSARFVSDYAHAKGTLLAFVRAKRKLLVIPPEGSEERTRSWTSPRTMTFMMRWLAASAAHGLSEIDRDQGITMFLGAGMAREFAAWRSMHDLPNVEDILDGKVEFKHNLARPDITMHVTTTAASLIRDLKDNREQRCTTIYAIMRQICEKEPDLCFNAAEALSKVPFKNQDKRKVMVSLFDSDEIVRAS